MTRRGQRRLIGLLLVLGGIVAVLIAGPLLLDQERYRGILISRVSQLLNRNVTAASLRVHLLPSPEVTIRDVVIADRAPWSEPFIDAEQLHVSLKLLPLLKGDIQVGNIRIDRPRIRLARGPDGWNLDDLIRRLRGARRPSRTAPKGQKRPEDSLLFRSCWQEPWPSAMEPSSSTILSIRMDRSPWSFRISTWTSRPRFPLILFASRPMDTYLARQPARLNLPEAYNVPKGIICRLR